MELRHLRYFIAVCEERSYRKAGERLHVSHSPINRQVHDLEREVGVSLLIQDNQGVKLTEAGQVFLDKARAIVDNVQAALELARAVARGEAGRLRIAHSYGYIDPSLPALIELFHAAHPDVEVELLPLHAREQFISLAQGEIEIGYCAVRSPDLEPLLHFEEIYSSRAGLVASARRIGGGELTSLSGFADDVFLMIRRSAVPQYHRWANDVFTALRFEPREVQEVESVQSMLALAAASVGVSLLPKRGIPTELLSAFHLLPPNVPPMKFHIAWRRHDTPPLVERFLSLLRGDAGKPQTPPP